LEWSIPTGARNYFGESDRHDGAIATFKNCPMPWAQNCFFRKKFSEFNFGAYYFALNGGFAVRL
jgi:hypothetical protein